MDMSGVALSREFYASLVSPVLAARWPGLRHAAGRLDGGSDVLGLDDAMSRDHDWGLRLDLLVAGEMTTQVNAYLEEVLPQAFLGQPVRFPVTWDPTPRHRVRVEDPASLLSSRIGIADPAELSVSEWLSITGQAALEVTAGPVFADTAGELTAARERLGWYPRDLWVYVVATDWARISQELPFIGRAAERGDDLGSRVIAARLVGVAMHLAHLLERRWPPYAKWLGTSLTLLPEARDAGQPLLRALAAPRWVEREEALVEALRLLCDVQRRAGLPTVADPVEPFFDRPYLGVRDDVIDTLEESISDPQVRRLPRGLGSVDQQSDNVDVLRSADRRRGMTAYLRHDG